jgi:uncharacterized protein YukE
VSDINEVVKDVQQRLRIFEGRYTDHFPRWTLRDYVQVSRLVSEVSTLSDTLRELQARVAELERQLNPPCPDPGIDAFYLEAEKEET